MHPRRLTFYAVRVGREPGVYTDAEVARQQTEGFSGAVQRKFTHRDEAERFVASNGGPISDPVRAGRCLVGSGVRRSETRSSRVPGNTPFRKIAW